MRREKRRVTVVGMFVATRLPAALALLLILAATALWGADQPVGYPSRAEDLDVLTGFRTPPLGYGEVGFYWWLGDPLTKERLTWQLDQLQDKSISALQVNYAHSDRGGRFWGLTIPSDPPLLSEPWWDLFGWFLKESRQRGMAASLSDYTLGWAGNGWYIDEILRDRPEVQGAALAHVTVDCAAECRLETDVEPLSAVAYPLENGRIVPGGTIDLTGSLRGRTLVWQAPAGRWRVVAVYAKPVPLSLDPMHQLSGKEMIAKFFQRFEDRNPGESGRGLNFFFSDELNFGVRGWLWNSDFRDEFRRRKGYDVVPELASLFEPTGPRAIKVRLDYSDVMVALEEENYFRPLYEWHHSRGMIYGCDHGGRGKDITEFGDYFRTQRWMTGPGNDQPGLASDLIKNKVASSIAHLYERPRTWLEGYYGSGWGTTSAQLVDATWRNFAHGHNLLTLHGLYYSTHGGWWEWAPPCNHFHMPYWKHMGTFLKAVERMSYLLSQGHHRADVAIVYPVAAMEAGEGGKESVDTAFRLGQYLYSKGIDFDFIDFESLARARVDGGILKVAGEEYRALVLPAMRTVRYSTIAKAAEFRRGGGVSIILGTPPKASERIGDDDPEVRTMAAELAHSLTNDEVSARIASAFPRDFQCMAGSQPYVLHRRAGVRDIYMVYGVERGAVCSFRATGSVELWDPWSGTTRTLAVESQTGGITSIRMPGEKTEAQLVVFQPGRPLFRSSGVAVAESKALDGEWEFELSPTLDNRFGDYRMPASNAFIGAEARRFRYADDSEAGSRPSDPQVADQGWSRTTYSFGPRFWKLGPLAQPLALGLERRIAASRSPDPSLPWQPYSFSLRWGIENDPGHQGYHGLKSEVNDSLIGLGRLRLERTSTVYESEEAGACYYLLTWVDVPRDMQARILAGGEAVPAAVWIAGAQLDPRASTAALKRGLNPVLLRYDRPGRGFFMLFDPSASADWTQTYPLSSSWFRRPGLLPFDTRPGEASPGGWYRTVAPPGLKALRMVLRGRADLWVDGRRVQLGTPRRTASGAFEYHARLDPPHPAPVAVAIHVTQERGFYAGAAWEEPLVFECVPGRLTAGDWSRIDGLSSYSGGGWYRRTLRLTSEQARRPAQLDLGSVSASAEVRVNGKSAGVRMAPPFRVDLTGLLLPGDNRIEVLVYSALSNHYQTIPTRYLAPSPSGLLGPVTLRFEDSER